MYYYDYLSGKLPRQQPRDRQKPAQALADGRQHEQRVEDARRGLRGADFHRLEGHPAQDRRREPSGHEARSLEEAVSEDSPGEGHPLDIGPLPRRPSWRQQQDASRDQRPKKRFRGLGQVADAQARVHQEPVADVHGERRQRHHRRPGASGRHKENRRDQRIRRPDRRPSQKG